jgi:hypothetical protein
MGGRGSGGHNSKRKRRDVQCARLDVHELAGDGKLTLGKRGLLFGRAASEQSVLCKLFGPRGEPAIAALARLSY